MHCPHFSKAIACFLSAKFLVVLSSCVPSAPPTESSAPSPDMAPSSTPSETSPAIEPVETASSTDVLEGPPSIEYKYEVDSDNGDTVTITEYTGAGGDIEIPSEIDGMKVTAIGNTFKETGAFQGCLSITSVVIPDGVTEIQDNAFQSCSNLETVVIPSSVTLLRNCAFNDCPNVKAVYFEGDAPRIANYVFSDAPDLIFYYHEDTQGWTNPLYDTPTEVY